MRDRTSRTVVAMAFALMASMILTGFPQTAERQGPPEQLSEIQTSGSYPNSDWLNIWLSMNESDLNTPDYYGPGQMLYNEFPGNATMTPYVTANYWGSDNFNVWNPYEWGYSDRTFLFSQMNDNAIFPTTSKISVMLSWNDTLGAADLSMQASLNSRITSAWVQGIDWGNITPAELSWLDANLTSVVPSLKLFIQVYDSASATGDVDGQWYTQTPYSITDYLPYFDGLWFSPWAGYSYSLTSYHQFAFESEMRDIASKCPGKELVAEIFNWQFADGVNTWDYLADTTLACAQLYREGIISQVVMAGSFWTQWNTITSNYLRAIFESEFHNYETVYNVATESVSTELDGTPVDDAVLEPMLKWGNNYTFYSAHTQNITFTNMVGSNLTVKNLRFGDVTILPGNYFVAAMGETYQIYNWPHVTTHYASPHPNIYINGTSAANDMLLTVEGSIFVNASYFLNRTVIQFGTGSYLHPVDLIGGNTPQHGIYFKVGDNYTWSFQNSTICPLDRAFSYVIQDGHANTAWNRHWYICNSTFTGWALTDQPYQDTFRPAGYTVWIADSIFSCPVFATASRPMKAITLQGNGNAIGRLHFVRTLIYANNPLLTLSKTTEYAYGLYLDLGQYCTFGYSFVHEDIIVGFNQGLTIESSTGSADSWMDDMQIYRSDYNVTADDHGVNAYPGLYTRDMASYWRYLGPVRYGDTYSWATVFNNVSTKFRLQGDIDFNGTLKDALGATIGSGSSTAHIFTLTGIDWYRNLEGVVSVVHPFPWTFTITSTLPAGHYYAVTAYGTFGVNRTMMWPRYMPLSGTGLTATISPEDVWDLHLVELPTRGVYENFETNVYEGLTIDLGQDLYPWTKHPYMDVPGQLPIIVTGTGAISLNVTSYTPTASLVASWTATGTSGTATFTMTDLTPNTIYTVYVDAVHVATLTSTVAGVISFPYSAWSTHTFQVYRPTTYDSDDTTDGGSGDRSPSSSETGSSSLSLSSLSVIAIASASVLILVVVLIRRPRGRSGKRYS